MHRLRPILALPIAVFMFAGAVLIAVLRDAIPAQLTLYVGLAVITVMLAAIFLAARIALATTPKPTLTFVDVLTLVFGTSRYEITGTGIKFDDLDDFALALVESAAIEDISIWGARVPIVAFRKIKSAMVKISSTYWEDHRINTLAHAEKGDSVTQKLLADLTENRQAMPISTCILTRRKCGGSKESGKDDQASWFDSAPRTREQTQRLVLEAAAYNAAQRCGVNTARPLQKVELSQALFGFSSGQPAPPAVLDPRLPAGRLTPVARAAGAAALSCWLD